MSINSHSKDQAQAFGMIRASDIILGRGNAVASHPGNKRFRVIIEAFKPNYQQAARQEKVAVAKMIISKIAQLDPPARFMELEIETGCVKEIDYKKSIEKVCQALRDKKLRCAKKSKDVDKVKMMFQSSKPTVNAREETSPPPSPPHVTPNVNFSKMSPQHAPLRAQESPLNDQAPLCEELRNALMMNLRSIHSNNSVCQEELFTVNNVQANIFIPNFSIGSRSSNNDNNRQLHPDTSSDLLVDPLFEPMVPLFHNNSRLNHVSIHSSNNWRYTDFVNGLFFCNDITEEEEIDLDNFAWY